MNRALSVDPRRRCLPLRDWPETDRRLWLERTAPDDGLDGPSYERSLNPRTLAKIERGYGRWLGCLKFRNILVEDSAPQSRVSAANVQFYFNLMRKLGNRDYTVVGRLVELQLAMRIIAPRADLDWLTYPGGAALRSLLHMTVREISRHDSRQLYLWGRALMEGAAKRPPMRRRIQFRDGLMIAILASRAPRLRAVTAMKLGDHVTRTGEDFRLDFANWDIKTGISIGYRLPKSLNTYIERYLAVERLELLKGTSHGAFWVNWLGEPLGEAGVEKRIRWWSEKKFGTAFGPHRFRHALGTSQAVADPKNPAAGAAVLGISAGMVEKHYNIGGQAEAARAFTAALGNARKKSEALARLVFEKAAREMLI